MSAWTKLTFPLYELLLLWTSVNQLPSHRFAFNPCHYILLHISTQVIQIVSVPLQSQDVSKKSGFYQKRKAKSIPVCLSTAFTEHIPCTSYGLSCHSKHLVWLLRRVPPYTSILIFALFFKNTNMNISFKASSKRKKEKKKASKRESKKASSSACSVEIPSIHPVVPLQQIALPHLVAWSLPQTILPNQDKPIFIHFYHKHRTLYLNLCDFLIRSSLRIVSFIPHLDGDCNT